MSQQCNYCDKKFTSISSLNKHKISAKYCLDIQKGFDKTNEKLFKCDFCDKILKTKQNLIIHKTTCNNIINKKEINLLKTKVICLNDQLCDYQNKLNENETLKDQLTQQNLIIAELKGKLEIYENDHQTLIDIAKQPKNIHTNNNKYMYLTPLNLTKEEIKRQVEDNFTENNFLHGQQGVAEFAFNNLLLDENGNSKYICNDVSRSTFIYKTVDGLIEKDYKGDNLIYLIYPDIINKSTIIKDIGQKNNKQQLLYLRSFEEIINLPKNKNVFNSTINILANRRSCKMIEYNSDCETEIMAEYCTDEDLRSITTDELLNHSKSLTIECIQDGIKGYVKYALDYPFKKNVYCSDPQNKNIKYKDKGQNIICDIGGYNICQLFFKSILRRNTMLCVAYKHQLEHELEILDCDDYDKYEERERNIMNTCDTINKYKIEIMEISKIINITKDNCTYFLQEFIDELCEYIQ